MMQATFGHSAGLRVPPRLKSVIASCRPYATLTALVLPHFLERRIWPARGTCTGRRLLTHVASQDPVEFTSKGGPASLRGLLR